MEHGDFSWFNPTRWIERMMDNSDMQVNSKLTKKDQQALLIQL